MEKIKYIKKYILLLFLILSFPLFIYSNKTDNIPKTIKVGDPAPTFVIKSLDGKLFFLRDFCGEHLRKPWINKEKKCVILSFFASWCMPCMEEIKILHKINDHNDNLIILLINVGEPREKVLQLAEKQNFKLPVLLDDYLTVSREYNIIDEKNNAKLPQLVFINKQGEIVYKSMGMDSPHKFINNILENIKRYNE